MMLQDDFSTVQHLEIMGDLDDCGNVLDTLMAINSPECLASRMPLPNLHSLRLDMRHHLLDSEILDNFLSKLLCFCTLCVDNGRPLRKLRISTNPEPGGISKVFEILREHDVEIDFVS